MNDYHFITHWRVPGTVEDVSEIIGDTTALPQWWPAVFLEAEELVHGDENGIGREVRVKTKGWLPYLLHWTMRTEEARRSHGYRISSSGDFVGSGEWTFEQDGPCVNITYDWQIRADKPLLKYFSFLLKPAFGANHRWAMEQGEISLRLELARRKAAADELAVIGPPPAPSRTSWLFAVPVAFGALLFLKRACCRHNCRTSR